MIDRKSNHADIIVEDADERTIVISRVFDAPRDLIWTIWTDPAHIVNWWGPRGFTTTTHSMEVKTGGQWSYVMHGPDGHDYDNLITYLEVVKPERLSYKHGGAGDTEHINFHVQVTFEIVGPDGMQTRVTSKTVFPSSEVKDLVIREYNAIEGGRQHFASMGEYLDELLARKNSTAQTLSEQFVITRVLRAAPEIVYQAWTDREQLQQWFGPKGMTIPECSLELRVGGMFHYAMRMPNGGLMWGRWIFREIVPPEKLVFVSSFADEAGNIARSPFSDNWPLETLSTITFEEHAGIGKGTVVTVRWQALNASDVENQTFHDGFASMRQGWGGTFDKLDEFLAK